MQSPLPGARITCDAPCHGYGATDFGANEGTPVYAMFSGTIDTFWLNGGGNTLDLHGNGLRAHYAHLRSYAVADGATVSEGQLIAYSGNTGSLTTGPHLHVGLLNNAGGAIYVNGAVAGPYEYLNSIGYDWSGGGATPIEERDTDMPTKHRAKGIDFIAAPGFFYKSADQAETDFLTARFGPSDPLGDDTSNDTWKHNLNRLLWAYGIPGGWDTWDKQPLNVAYFMPTTAPATTVDTSALTKAIAALDAQSDSYQAELKALLAKGLSGTLTLKP